jgi:hypothetical protein
MDQAKTNIPNTKLLPKSISNLWKLRTHVTGVLLHTKSPHGKIAYAFVDLLEYPHDSNLTITILMKVLHQYITNHSQLPETLYLQMDNTSRENKNRFVFGFCSILVELKIFKKVRLSCMLHVLFTHSTTQYPLLGSTHAQVALATTYLSSLQT